MGGYWLQVPHRLFRYHNFGLPQSRSRIIIAALKTHDPKVITFESRSYLQVFKTIGALMNLYQCKPVCATKYLLPCQHPHVETRLKQVQELKKTKPEQGYNVEAAMKIARESGIEWWDLQVDNWPLLARSPWWPVLSRRQQDALTYNLRKHIVNKSSFLSIASHMGHGRILTKKGIRTGALS